MDDLESRVIKTIARQLRIEELSVEHDASISDDLGADSLDAVEIIMALEDEFEVLIPDEDAAAIKTVRQAVAYVALAVASERNPAS